MNLLKKSLHFGALCLLLSFFSLQAGFAQGFTVVITQNQPVSCNGAQDAALTASVPTVPGAGNSYQYHWSTGATTAAIEGIGAGTYVVTVSSVTGAMVIGTALVNQPAPLQLDIAVNGAITCTNLAVQLAAQASGGTQPYEYNWSSGQNSAVITVTLGGIEMLALTDQHGCQLTATANVVVNNDPPVIEGLDSATLLCTGESIEIEKVCTSSSTVGYQWFGPNGQPISGGTVASIEVANAGLYQVKVTDFSNGCIALDSVHVQSDYLLSTPVNQANIYLDSIVIHTTGGVAPYQYVWRTTAGVPQSTDQNLINAPAGFYFLTTTDQNGCSATSGAYQLQNTVSAVPVVSAADAGISVFPNPATDLVQLTLPDERNMTLQVYNAFGQMIATQILRNTTASIDVSAWPNGWYSIQIQHQSGISNVKLVKQ